MCNFRNGFMPCFGTHAGSSVTVRRVLERDSGSNNTTMNRRQIFPRLWWPKRNSDWTNSNMRRYTTPVVRDRQMQVWESRNGVPLTKNQRGSWRVENSENDESETSLGRSFHFLYIKYLSGSPSHGMLRSRTVIVNHREYGLKERPIKKFLDFCHIFKNQ